MTSRMSDVTFSRTFAAAHRLQTHPGKCRNIHGHNYQATVTISGQVNETGMVVEFDEIKSILDRPDHKTILEDTDPLVDVLESNGMMLYVVDFPPTTENLASHFAQEIYAHIGVDGNEYSVIVTLSETDSISSSAMIVPA